MKMLEVEQKRLRVNRKSAIDFHSFLEKKCAEMVINILLSKLQKSSRLFWTLRHVNQ
jgi:hypothetical protein